MGRNRNARRKQQLGLDSGEQTQASSLLIDFEQSDPPAENAASHIGGLDVAGDMEGDEGAYGQGEFYSTETGSF